MEADYIVELRRQLRRFVEQKATREKHRKWDCSHQWPRELFRELPDMGLCALTVPEEYGGTRQNILAAVARGELLFAYRLSEPDVGGDLKSVKTRARIEGNLVVVNGAKRLCTGADWADHIYCLVNSDPAAS